MMPTPTPELPAQESSGPESPAPDHTLALRIAKDSQQRMITGIFSYPMLWLLIGIGSDWHQQYVVMFWLICALMVLMTLVRYLHLKALPRYAPEDLPSWTRGLHWLMLPHSLCWGLLFAYALQQSNPMFLLYMTFSTAGVVAGGVNNFATNAKVEKFFIVSMLLPAIIVTSVFTADWFMTALLSVYLLFISDLARRQIREYRSSLENELTLAKLSRTDALTQLDNRRHFDDKLTELCQLSSRSREKLSVAIVDCDHFKVINDRYGHDVGDRCLKHLAMLLRSTLPRATDTCARYGGEEFSLILPGTDLAGARQVAERVRHVVETSPLQLADRQISMTVSIGVVSRSIQGYEPELPTQLFKQADQALYLAKERGRNRCVHVYYFGEGQRDIAVEDASDGSQITGSQLTASQAADSSAAPTPLRSQQT